MLGVRLFSTYVLAVIVAIIAATLIGVLGWRLWTTTGKQNLHQAIADVWNKDLPEHIPEYLQYIDRSSRFQIETIEKGEPWVVTVTVTGIDLAGELENENPWAYSGNQDTDAMDEYLLSLVKKAERMERTATIYAWPEDDGYRIQFTETFIDAMTGGVYGYTMELIQEVTGGIS